MYVEQPNRMLLVWPSLVLLGLSTLIALIGYAEAFKVILPGGIHHVRSGECACTLDLWVFRSRFNYGITMTGLGSMFLAASGLSLRAILDRRWVNFIQALGMFALPILLLVAWAAAHPVE